MRCGNIFVLYLLFVFSATTIAKNVLVVDDDALTLSYAKEDLEEAGHSVTTASSAEKALALIDGGARFDVVISDYSMPGGMSGDAFLTEIHRRFPDLLLIMFSDHAAADRLNLPFQFHLVRPTQWEKIPDLLSTPTDRSSCASIASTALG
jgi:CheY-like chemotaxis protein